MIYESKQAAKEAADRFSLESLEKGRYVRKRHFDRSIVVDSAVCIDGEWDMTEFEFSTLKKGDLCWCESFLRIFTGDYNDKGDPLFSSSRDFGCPSMWKHFEPTWLNIFEKE